MQEWIVPADLHSARIDCILAKLAPQYSRSQWAKWINAAKVHVNGHIVKPKTKIAAHTLIQAPIDQDLQCQFISIDAPEAIPLVIVYEDDALLVINKPAGLVVHPGAGNAQHTLMNAILHYVPNAEQLPRAGIVHRLDKDTTGLLVIAKTLSVHTTLVRMLAARQISRHYYALVYGKVAGAGTINTCFGRHPKHRLKMAVRPQGKAAITHYKVISEYGPLTALKIILETGRTHQIRVHLAYKHWPIVGDALYGHVGVMRAEWPDILKQTLSVFTRQALHAEHLELIHPLTQQFMQFSAPLPQDLSVILQQLEHVYGN